MEGADEETDQVCNMCLDGLGNIHRNIRHCEDSASKRLEQQRPHLVSCSTLGVCNARVTAFDYRRDDTNHPTALQETYANQAEL